MSECPHASITHEPHDAISGLFTCLDCGAKLVMRTKSGNIITHADMDRWIEEAEVTS